MRRSVAVIATLFAAHTAIADNPRDVFGLHDRPHEELPACDDGLAFNCATATDPLDDATPYALSTWLPAAYLLRLPVGDATHDAVAHFAMGASRDEAGPGFGGATGLENRWTIDGTPADGLRTGGADTRVPLTFLSGMYVSAGGFSARDRASTGGTIDARLVRGTPHHEVQAYVWSSLNGESPARPIASGSFQVRRLTLDTPADFSGSVVATGPLGPLLGGQAWYAAGVAPSLALTDWSWRASRVLDKDNNGLPDGFPGPIQAAAIEDTSTRTTDYFVPAMARVGLDRGPHRFELTLIGQAQRDSRFLANATLQAAGIDRTTHTLDAIAAWNGRWTDTRARAILAWHRSTRTESVHDPAARDLPQLLSAYVPAKLPEDPGLAAACDDTSPDDPAKNIANCPVPFGFFASGGAGPLVESIGDRPSATADITHREGLHVLRAGATYEDARLVNTTVFTGNEVQRSIFDGQVDRQRFYHGDCVDMPGGQCDYADSSQLTYRTLYVAAYGEDTITPEPGLQLDAGVRWELMWVGPRLHFSHEIAPRAGIAWDLWGNGRSRLWATLGRTYATLTAGLGPTVIARDATVHDQDTGFSNARSHDAGSAFRIMPGIEPVAQDEVTLGAEVALIGALRATAWAQGRFVRRGIETTPDGFDNPGRNGDIAATRESETLAAQLEMAAHRTTTVRAGLMWDRTVGTWTGPFDPRIGATLLAAPEWDANASNLYGPLPTDAGYRLYIEAERRGTIAGIAVAAATRLTVASGRPRNVLADGDDGIVELLPRGSAGRNPVITQANLRLAARWHDIDVTLDVFDVFDRATVTNLDEIYSADAVRPIDGGSYDDLVFLKNDAGAAARRRTAFRLPTGYQAPISATLGIHAAF